MTAFRSWIAALSIVACAVALRAGANNPATSASTNGVQTVRDQVAGKLGFDSFQVQNLGITAAQDELLVDVVVDGSAVRLQLERFSLRAPVFQVLIQADASGELTPIEAPPVRTYSGQVMEWPEARVAASFRDGRLEATIHKADQRFIIEPLSNFEIAEQPGPAAHIVYDAADMPATGFGCGVTEESALIKTLPQAPSGERRTSGTGLEVAEVGYDAGHVFYLEENSSTTQVIDVIESITNGVRLDYEVAAIGMTFEITAIVIRVDANDPYTSANAGTLLGQFENTWDSAPENSIPRDCAQLYTGINLNPPPIGIAATFTGCFPFDAYSLIETNSVGSFGFQVALSSHEFGHIWGALHCDGCGGCGSCCRIMCSGLGGCTGISSSFGCNSTSAISAYMNSVSCLSDLPPAATLPFCEDWTDPSIDPARWLFVKGAIPSGAASNPPSDPFVIELDASGGNEHQDDELRSNFINLLGQSNVEFSYYTQHQGVEAGEQLFVEYRSNAKNWINLNTITSNGASQSLFVYHTHTLPSDANHAEFQMRFRTDVNGVSDNWFIDDISLDCFPPPVCEEPCTDGQACTINDVCLDGVQCGGEAVDCSAVGGECSVATCDPIGTDGNCDIVVPDNDGGACDGAAGYCDAGACSPADEAGRVFMAVNGAQNTVNTGGPTSGLIGSGLITTIGVFIEENSAAPPLFNGYQVILPFEATPLPGATGTVTYVDNDPGNGSLGDSVFLDSDRPDWVFNGEVVLPPNYNETPDLGIFGVIYNTFAQQGIDLTTLSGPRYLAEFQVEASADASGDFEIRFNLPPMEPPHTNLFNPFGAIYPIGQTQPLILTVGDLDCITVADCGDMNNDGFRDDACTWYDCVGGMCVQVPRSAGQADLGGFNGACPIDGACDGNDQFHALNCFSNISTLGAAGYPCEQNPPSAVNVDAGGQGISCTLDGVCDGNDAFHALNCFENIDSLGTPPYPCGCSGPQPLVPGQTPGAAERTAVMLRAPKRAVPGDLIAVDVFLADPLQALRGVQLHLEPSGGRQGALTLHDISVHAERVDYAFGQASQPFLAYNRETQQMVAGLAAPQGTPTAAGAYVATYTYLVTDDARGTFRVDLRVDPDGTQPQARTFLFGENARPIAVDAVNAAVIQVMPRRSRTR